MKKVMLFMFMIVPMLNYGQTKKEYFELTPKGIVNKSDPKTDFLVFDFPGKSASELFNAVLLYANKSFVSPKDVVSKVDNQSVTLNGVGKNVVHGRMMTTFDINFSITFQFKDDKVRVNMPSINSMTGMNGGQYQTMYLASGGDAISRDQGIFTNKGKLKRDRAKENVEQYFNSLLGRVLDNVSKGNNDW